MFLGFSFNIFQLKTCNEYLMIILYKIFTENYKITHNFNKKKQIYFIKYFKMNHK